MKTTVDLPDDLLVAAKQKAAEWRCTLKTLVERGLRDQIHRSPTAGRRRRPIRWVVIRGGLPPGVDVRDRSAMHEWLIDPL